MEAVQAFGEILRDFGAPIVLAALVILGVLVPKAYYDREIVRGDKATEAASNTAAALTTVSEAMKTIGTELGALKATSTTEIAALRQEVKELREDIRVLRSAGG